MLEALYYVDYFADDAADAIFTLMPLLFFAAGCHYFADIFQPAAPAFAVMLYCCRYYVAAMLPSR